MKPELVIGQKVVYVGKGYLGFNKEHDEMIYQGRDENSFSDVWVEDYRGIKIKVRSYEIEAKK